MSEWTQAVNDIAEERRGHVEREGWTPEHDDTHTKGELAKAAVCYALPRRYADGYIQETIKRLWPWDWKWWKPTNRRRDLVKAGALIVAEIERIDRARGEG